MHNDKGFTLLELIVVLAIGAVLTAVAVHTISSRVPGQHLKGASLAFQSDLNRAKMEALKSRKQYKVTVSGNSYTFLIGNLASGSSSWTADSTMSLPYPDVTFSSTSGDFIFDPRGTASSTGTGNIVLTNSATTATRTISVSLAGRIRST